MDMVRQLTVAVMLRWRQVTAASQRDRGDSPVPSAIIIAGLALLAIAVVAWAVAKANNYMNSSPNGPAGP